jgi:hypothetical protein
MQCLKNIHVTRGYGHGSNQSRTGFYSGVTSQLRLGLEVFLAHASNACLKRTAIAARVGPLSLQTLVVDRSWKIVYPRVKLSQLTTFSCHISLLYLLSHGPVSVLEDVNISFFSHAHHQQQQKHRSIRHGRLCSSSHSRDTIFLPLQRRHECNITSSSTSGNSTQPEHAAQHQ